MNDFSEIEAELKKLRPAPVRTELLAGIENALAQPAPGTPASGLLPQRRAARGNWLPLGLGVGLVGTAVFLMLARIGDEQQPSKQPTVARPRPAPVERGTPSDLRFVPTGLTEVVYRTRDEGLQFSEGAEQPVRRMHYETRETLRWRNPETGATLHVSYPSEEVVLIPVSGQ